MTHLVFAVCRNRNFRVPLLLVGRLVPAFPTKTYMDDISSFCRRRGTLKSTKKLAGQNKPCTHTQAHLTSCIYPDAASQTLTNGSFCKTCRDYTNDENVKMSRIVLDKYKQIHHPRSCCIEVYMYPWIHQSAHFFSSNFFQSPTNGK